RTRGRLGRRSAAGFAQLLELLEVGARAGVFGIELERLAKGRLRLVVAALLRQRRAEVDVGGAKLRIRRDGSLVKGDGAIELPRDLIAVAQVLEKGGSIGRQRDRALQVRQR